MNKRLVTFASVFQVVLSVLLSIDVSCAQFSEEDKLRNLANSDNNISAVRQMLAQNVNPNVPDSSGRTSVHEAASTGSLHMLEMLLAAGGRAQAQDFNGNSPLHLAADASSSVLSEDISNAAISKLLKFGANPNIANHDGDTPLHVAARTHGLHSSTGIESLLSAGAAPNRFNAKGYTPLHTAVESYSMHNADVVRALLSSGAQATAVNGNGFTALQLIARYGPDDGSIITLLLQSGANPNRKNPQGDTPLHIAIRTGGSTEHPEKVGALLAGGANPCITNGQGQFPYEITQEDGLVSIALGNSNGHNAACGMGNTDVIKTDTVVVKSDTVVAKTVRTMWATKRSNVRQGPGVEYEKVGLLEIGEEVHVTGESGQWLRIQTVGGGDAFVYAPLLADAEPATLESFESNWFVAQNQPCQLWSLDPESVESVTWSGGCIGGKASGKGRAVWSTGYGQQIYEGEFRDNRFYEGIQTTADGTRYVYRNGKVADADASLLQAAAKGHIEVVRALLDAGADVNTKSDDGYTPLDFANMHEESSVAGILIANGGKATKSDYTLDKLYLAIYDNKLNRVIDLLAAGADVNAKDSDGYTPLYSAVNKGNTEIVRALLTAGADVNAKFSNSYGATLLHDFMDGDEPESFGEIAKLLLAAGADVHAKDSYGNTPLHDVATFDNTEIVKTLLAAGADVNAKNRYGLTPMDFADGEIADVLSSAGAIINKEKEWAILTDSDGSRYEGETWHGLLKHGKGTNYWASGDRYEGEHEFGKIHGRGTYHWANGNRYEGEFNNGKMHGRGTYHWASGGRYEGDSRNGERHGRGTYFYADGTFEEQEWRNGDLVSSIKEAGDSTEGVDAAAAFIGGLIQGYIESELEVDLSDLVGSSNGFSPGTGGSGGSSGCPGENSLNAKIEQMNAQLNDPNTGYCQSARAAKQVFTQAISFYQGCPSADPTGEWLEYSRQMVAWANETERQTCEY